jgi:hypothetical protein
VQVDQSRLSWRKSSKSSEQSCVEVATSNQSVFVRDSKDPDGQILRIDVKQWAAFLEDVKQASST